MVLQAPLVSTSTDQLLPWLQDRMPVTGKPEKLMDLKGTDLLGLPVKVRWCMWLAVPWTGDCRQHSVVMLPACACLATWQPLRFDARVPGYFCPPQSPRTEHERIYVLPLLTILTNKARGKLSQP